jgi:hypothetical protein
MRPAGDLKFGEISVKKMLAVGTLVTKWKYMQSIGGQTWGK